jgi:rpsU-divergently transcribed protein
MKQGNAHMSYALEAHTPELSTLDVNARIAAGVKARLEYHMTRYGGGSSWAQAMALGAHPAHIQETLQHLAIMADEIWYWAGDRSVNMQWYSRRVLLLGVYAATETFMLTDTSVGYKDTWAFLDRRLQEVSEFGRMAGERMIVAQSIVAGVGNVVGAGLDMVGKPFIVTPGQHVLKTVGALSDAAVSAANVVMKNSSSSSNSSSGSGSTGSGSNTTTTSGKVEFLGPLSVVASAAQQVAATASSVAASAGIRLPDPVQVVGALGSLLPQVPSVGSARK